MRKRLRKKRRLQEFTQLAFLAKAQVNQSLPEMAREALLDRFLLEAIEGNDLSCGGGCGPWEWDLVVCANGRRSASENDRQRVGTWLRSQAHLSSVFIGPLADAWHGDEEAFEEPHGDLSSRVHRWQNVRGHT